LAADPQVDRLPAPALLQLCKALKYSGAAGQATALLRRGQQRFPGDFWVNHTLAALLLDQQPPGVDEAIRYFSIALALRASPGVHVTLGAALVRKGALDEALAAFGRAVALDDTYAGAHAGRGGVLMHQGRLDEAEAACRRALRLSPNLA